MSLHPVDQLKPDEAEEYLVALLQPVTTRLLRDEALDVLPHQNFSSAALGAIWGAARGLRGDAQSINRRSLLGRLAETGATRGGLAEADRVLTRCQGFTPPASEFAEAVAEVQRCGGLRRILEACDAIKQQAVMADDPAHALALAYDRLNALDRESDQADDVKPYADLLDAFLAEQRSPDAGLVIPTPWHEINDALNGGVRGGRMYVIGARPGDGKSIAAHQIAQHAADLGHPTLVFSAEMDAAEVTGRMVSSGAQVDQSQITRRALDAGSWSRIDRYADRARRYPLSVVDKGNLTAAYLKAVCRNEKRRNGTVLVVVDYLQLLDGDGNGRHREQEVAAISRKIKQLARELDVAFVVAAQVNRDSVRHNRRPVMADLRESGGIEADADVVMLHSRPVVESGPRKGEPGWTLLVDIVKNRHGRTAAIELDWRPAFATIGNDSEMAAQVMPFRRADGA